MSDKIELLPISAEYLEMLAYIDAARQQVIDATGVGEIQRAAGIKRSLHDVMRERQLLVIDMVKSQFSPEVRD